MTTFPPLPEQNGGTARNRRLRSEHYAFQVDGNHYTLRFWPMTYLEDYDEHQLAALEATAAYEVSFRLEDYTLPDGTILAGYDVMGTGNAFHVLGGVAISYLGVFWNGNDFAFAELDCLIERQEANEKTVGCGFVDAHSG